MKEIYKPCSADIERCMRIRKSGKRGEYTSKDDGDFVFKMYQKYPEWFKETEPIVFNETVPFGSTIRLPVKQDLLDEMIEESNENPPIT